MHTVLNPIATANPPFKRSQTEFAQFMARVEGIPHTVCDRIAKVYARSGIEYRYSCVEDFGIESEDFTFFAKNWTLSPVPTTQERNRIYQTAALDLAEQAAAQAIDQAQLLAGEITHLIVVSCTGFFAPGLDIHLIQRLHLPATTDRTLIGFMGCNGAFNGLKTAHAICQTHKTAKVLMVCVELCTIHCQIANTLETAIVNAIFSDGAAAVVLTAKDDPAGQLVYTDSAALIAKDSLNAMTWEVGDTGFLMTLSSQVPNIIQENLPTYLKLLLERHQLQPQNLDFWAVHPGGRQILDQVRASLALSTATLQESYDILRRYGNMSSPTILFILKQIMEAPSTATASKPRQGVAVGFGPGLSIEGALFQQFA